MPFSVKQPEQFPLFLFTLLPSMHMEYIVVLDEMVEAIADVVIVVAAVEFVLVASEEASVLSAAAAVAVLVSLVMTLGVAPAS